MLRDEMQSLLRRQQIEGQYEKDKITKDLERFKTESEDLKSQVKYYKSELEKLKEQQLVEEVAQVNQTRQHYDQLIAKKDSIVEKLTSELDLRDKELARLARRVKESE